MLKGISHLISPDLLKILCEMGHGDEIVLADAHFPGHSFNDRVVRADGLSIADLLLGILPLFEVDAYDDSPVVMMAAVDGDELDPSVEANYMKAFEKYAPNFATVQRLDRFAFYDRARKAYAIVMTGELAKYGNILIKKGVTPVADT